MDCIDNPAIEQYLRFSREGRGNKDVWAEFRLLARRLKAIEPKIRAKYKEMLRESSP